MPKTDKKLKGLKESVAEALGGQFIITIQKLPMKIIERFRNEARQLKDIRAVWDIEYPLESIVLMVFIAVLAGSDTWIDIEHFCKAKKEWLCRFIELPNDRPPCNDTFSRVFKNIDQEEFHALTGRFVKDNLYKIKHGLGLSGGSSVKHYAIDGKQERGTGRLAGTDQEMPDQQTLHIYETTEGICIMSRRIDSKTNEIPVAQELLESFQTLEGVIISGDAMHTQVEHTRIIIRKGGNYVFGVKGNQSNLKEEVVLLFNDEKIKELKMNSDLYFRVCEKAHSQIETREYLMIKDTELPSAVNGGWSGLKAYMLVIKTCENCITGETTTEKRYYISSLEDVEMFATIIRQHWSTEIHHFYLDYIFHQDANQTTDENAFQNLAAIKKMTLALIRIYSVLENLSVNVTRKKLGWDPETEIAKLLSFYDEETLEKALNSPAALSEKTKRTQIKVQAYRRALESE